MALLSSCETGHLQCVFFNSQTKKQKENEQRSKLNYKDFNREQLSNALGQHLPLYVY
jgi:hypothetical protein